MRKAIPLVLLLSVAVLTGCASVRRTTPHIGVGQLDVNLDRKDVEVLDVVEGVSTVLSICGPIVQIVDGTDMRILGISAIEDRYSFAQPLRFPFSLLQGIYVSAADRAYYNALAASPDADAVFSKSYRVQRRGIPFIYMKEKVTFTGKAFKLKADSEK